MSPMAAAPKISSGDVLSRVSTKAITIPGRTECARPSLTSASRLSTRKEPARAQAAAVTAAIRMVHSSITWSRPPFPHAAPALAPRHLVWARTGSTRRR